MKKNHRKVILKIVFFLLAALAVASLVMAKKKAKEERDSYIIHALGGLDGKSYINSIDCLRKCYDAGYRIFEADVSFTSDGVLVMAHSGENNIWTSNDWYGRLGQEYPFTEGAEVPERYDKQKHLATYKDFMSFRIQGRYKATSFEEILDFMGKHDDMYLMIDAGYRNYEDTMTFYQEVVRLADGRTDVLDRIIASGQTTDMVKAARMNYDFPLVNLYYNTDEKREEILSTPEKFVSYCEEYGITSFSVDKEVYTEDVAKVLENSSLKSYVFTVNDSAEEKLLRSYGADVIGTDFLWEE